MRITLYWWQLVVGVSSPLLEEPSHLIPYLEPHWLSTMRHFLGTMNASLHIDGFAQSLPKPLCEKYTYIMGVIISLPNVSKSDLRAISRCRIYFGVAHISEIASADGLLVVRDA
jgi:hypothetical protein